MPETLGFKRLPQNSRGQLQHQRGGLALQEDHFSVQARSMSDWLRYLYSYSRQLKFYAEGQALPETWQSTLPDPEQFQCLADLITGKSVDTDTIALAQRPDISLLLSFIQMQERIKPQFNCFSERHKLFYYRHILGLSERPAVTDKAHLVITLSDDTPSMTLEPGRRFIGGEDSEGKRLVYRSSDIAVLNHSQVSTLFSLNSTNRKSGKLLLSRYIDVTTGLSMPEQGSGGPSAYSFGEATILDNETQLVPQLGFVIASELLYLEGGTRTIDVVFSPLDIDIVMPNLKENFDIYLSVAEERLRLNPLEIIVEDLPPDPSAAEVDMVDNLLKIVLPPLFPSVTHLNADIAPVNLNKPFIEFILKTDSSDVTIIQSLDIAKVAITVNVVGLPNAVINYQGRFIENSETVQLFGIAPRKNSEMRFGHAELLNKPIRSLAIQLDWINLPDVNLATYYKDYSFSKEDDSTWKFSVQASDLIEDLNEFPILGRTALGSDKDDFSVYSETLVVSNDLQKTLSPIGPYKRLGLTEKILSEWPRWFSLRLQVNDFGHHSYGQVSQAKSIKALKNNEAAAEKYITAVPYTPTVSSLTIDYTAQQEWNLDQALSVDNSGLLLVDVMGYKPIDTRFSSFSLLPSYSRHGYLYIAVSGMQAPGQCRLYFEMDVADGANTTNNIDLKWEFLQANEWLRCSRSKLFGSSKRVRIIEDSTMDLLDSGIIVFELPEMDFSTFMSDGLLWLRLSARDDIDSSQTQLRYSRIKQIASQGIEVELDSNDYAASHFQQPLAAQSISELALADYRIDNVSQLYSSFAAKTRESADSFSVRISERLRHKQRALNAWDIEHIVLAEFTELYQARCYQLLMSDQLLTSDQSLASQSQLKLMLIPINHDDSVLQPKLPLYLKRKIEEYINDFCMMGETIEVVDAEYLELQLLLNIKIKSGVDIASSVLELNQLLVELLSPWNHVGSESSLTLAWLQLADIGREIIKHPAVDVILSLQANVLLPAKGTSSASAMSLEAWLEAQSQEGSINQVLVSAEQHNISIINQSVEVFDGVGAWEIGYDFIVN